MEKKERKNIQNCYGRSNKGNGQTKLGRGELKKKREKEAKEVQEVSQSMEW